MPLLSCCLYFFLYIFFYIFLTLYILFFQSFLLFLVLYFPFSSVLYPPVSYKCFYLIGSTVFLTSFTFSFLSLCCLCYKSSSLSLIFPLLSVFLPPSLLPSIHPSSLFSPFPPNCAAVLLSLYLPLSPFLPHYSNFFPLPFTTACLLPPNLPFTYTNQTVYIYHLPSFSPRGSLPPTYLTPHLPLLVTLSSLPSLTASQAPQLARPPHTQLKCLRRFKHEYSSRAPQPLHFILATRAAQPPQNEQK